MRMTVAPSLISHPAVPSQRRITRPFFAVLGGFCAARARIPVRASAVVASTGFSIAGLRNTNFVQSLTADRNSVNALSHLRRFQKKWSGGWDPAPAITLLRNTIVRRALQLYAHLPAQEAHWPEIAPPPLSLLAPSWTNSRQTPPAQSRRNSPCRQTSDVSPLDTRVLARRILPAAASNTRSYLPGHSRARGGTWTCSARGSPLASRTGTCSPSCPVLAGNSRWSRRPASS